MEAFSLAKKITEIDRLELLRAQVLKEFAVAVRAASDRLIGYDESAVTGHRDRLLVVAAEIEAARSMDALRAACQSLAGVLDEHRCQGEAFVTQLQNEIQTLRGGAALSTLPSTSAPVNAVSEEIAASGLSRTEFEHLVRIKAEKGETFCLVIFWMSNLAHLFAESDPDLVTELMESSAKALAGALVGNPIWTRWDDDCFVVCTQKMGQQAAAWAQEIAVELSGPRSIVVGNVQAELPLKIANGVVEHPKGEAAEKALARAAQLIRNFRMMV